MEVTPNVDLDSITFKLKFKKKCQKNVNVPLFWILRICLEKLLNDVTDCTFEVGTCSCHVCMERLLNDGTDCPFEV